MNPYPNPRMPLLTEDSADDGSTVYSYWEQNFPYVLQYVIFEPLDDSDGLITVIDLLPPDRR